MNSCKTESRRGRRRYHGVVAAVLMLTGPGCASLTLLNIKSDKIPIADAEHPAIECLAIWQAAEGPGVGGIPTRGFAGQIFFFTQDRATPVAVDGKARIYVFDDHGSVQEQARPLHQFDFDRDSWRAHLQNSKLGPTYGVFIPYPRNNDYHQAICSLRVRFTPPKGRPLYSASSTIALSGPPLKPDTETSQVSPLNSLAKKLQAQSQATRPWANPSVATDPRPFSTAPQGAAAGDAYAMAPNSTVEASQGARVNPIIQTNGTAVPVTAATAAQSSNGVGYAVGVSEGPTPDSAPLSGRFKLQAAATNADWSSDADGSAAGQQPADMLPGAPIAHPSHPLAD